MAKTIDKLKEKLINDVLSMSELENIMGKYDYIPVEVDSDDMIENVIKFTNFKSQIWIYGEMDNDNCILINKVSSVNRIHNDQTRVQPFKSYEDLNNVLNWFYERKKYEGWLIGWLMTSLGRRVGDIVSMKWKDLYKYNGKYRERLTTLKEEKTGKIVGVRLNRLAQSCIEEYCKVMNIDPMLHYDEKIFTIGDSWFRKQVKQAANESGIQYEVSTHSFRKFHASTIYKMHPQDVDRLTIVQSILGHSDPEKTKLYIGEIDEKIDQYNEDFADYMLKKRDGFDVEMDNSPVISMKVEDLREVLNIAWIKFRESEDKFDSISEILCIIEKNRV